MSTDEQVAELARKLREVPWVLMPPAEAALCREGYEAGVAPVDPDFYALARVALDHCAAQPAAGGRTLIPVEPPPTWIESSGRWKWSLPERACFPGCCTAVVTASREWWEYAPSEAKPHPHAEGVMLRDEVWYWAVPTTSPHEPSSLRAERDDARILAASRFAQISTLRAELADARGRLADVIQAASTPGGGA